MFFLLAKERSKSFTEFIIIRYRPQSRLSRRPSVSETVREMPPRRRRDLDMTCYQFIA